MPFPAAPVRSVPAMSAASQHCAALLTTTEVAEILRVSAETVRDMAKDGRLVAVDAPTRGLRFRAADIERLTGGDRAVA
jgi:excisionase family DNA binding protein